MGKENVFLDGSHSKIMNYSNQKDGSGHKPLSKANNRYANVQGSTTKLHNLTASSNQESVPQISAQCPTCIRLNEQCDSLERRLSESNQRMSDLIAANDSKT